MEEQGIASPEKMPKGRKLLWLGPLMAIVVLASALMISFRTGSASSSYQEFSMISAHGSDNTPYLTAGNFAGANLSGAMSLLPPDTSNFTLTSPATMPTMTPELRVDASSVSTMPSKPSDASSTISTTTVEHTPLPKEVRGFYWTGYTAGSSRVNDLLAFAVSSHLNTVVVDLKADDGELSFLPHDPGLAPYAPKHPAIRDLDGLLEKLRSKGMYRIARIFIMRDGTFGRLNPKIVLRNADGSVWLDKTGTSWLDPAAPEVVDYAVELAHEAYARGFDEVQFDYVRFPSDGHISEIQYPVYDKQTSMAEVMRTLFQGIGQALQSGHVPVSFDLFGLVCCSADDLGIGQRLADAYPFSDFISPMMYPSHYASGFEGFANPADHPYDVVKHSLDQSLVTLQADDPSIEPAQALLKLRPWIQDFDIGAKYTAPMIEAEIKAVRDAGTSGWLLWNASNIYTPARYTAH